MNEDLPETMVKNAWRHGKYSWFPPAPAAEPGIVDAEEAEPADSEEMELRKRVKTSKGEC